MDKATAIPASEARVHLGDVLRRVRMGEHIVIEKGGTPIAALIDLADYEEYRRLKEAGELLTPAVVSEPTPDGLERMRRAFGGWADMDVEQLRENIRASRKISRRAPITLD